MDFAKSNSISRCMSRAEDWALERPMSSSGLSTAGQQADDDDDK